MAVSAACPAGRPAKSGLTVTCWTHIATSATRCQVGWPLCFVVMQGRVRAEGGGADGHIQLPLLSVARGTLTRVLAPRWGEGVTCWTQAAASASRCQVRIPDRCFQSDCGNCQQQAVQHPQQGQQCASLSSTMG
jgi:hypothetical protein